MRMWTGRQRINYMVTGSLGWAALAMVGLTVSAVALPLTLNAGPAMAPPITDACGAQIYTNMASVPRPTSNSSIWLTATGSAPPFSVTAIFADIQSGSSRSGVGNLAHGSVRTYRRFPRVQLTGFRAGYEKLVVQVEYVMEEQGSSRRVQESITVPHIKPQGYYVIDCKGVEDQTGESVSGYSIPSCYGGSTTYISRTRHSPATMSFLRVRISDPTGLLIYSGKWGTEPAANLNQR